jgi:hypothetical protein
MGIMSAVIWIAARLASRSMRFVRSSSTSIFVACARSSFAARSSASA